MIEILIKLTLMSEIILINKYNELNFNIIKILDCDTRTNIYIGVTGIMVAIVIFIAEIVTEKNQNETKKSLILCKTNIIEIVKKMIITLAIIWLSQLIKPENVPLYIIIQLITNGLIVYSMINTFKAFYEAIKLNTNKSYFGEQLNNYRYSIIKKSEKDKENSKNKNNERNEELFNFLKESTIFKMSNYQISRNNEYKYLYSLKNGYIESYDLYVLNMIEEKLKINIKSNNDKTQDEKSNAEIYLCNEIGNKCDKRFPIVYYKNVDDEIINLVNKSIIINSKNVDLEINKVLDDLFDNCKNDFRDFDKDNSIFNFYAYISREKYDEININFFEKIYEQYRKIINSNNEDFNINFSDFLMRLLQISYSYNKFEDFKNINSDITYLYIQRIRKDNVDLKMIAYEYANNVFNRNKYSINRNDDYKYYDVMMKNLLLIIKEFFSINRIDVIYIIFNNIYFGEILYDFDKNFSENEIVNFQFVIGILYIIFNLCAKEETEEKEKVYLDLKLVKKLINILQDKFFQLYDIWDIIVKFKRYANKKSEIYDMVKDMDFDNENHKYQNLWTCSYKNIDETLKCFVYMFNIDFCDLNRIDQKLVDRCDKIYFKKLLHMFLKTGCDRLEKFFKYDEKQKENVKKVLEKVIKIAQNKEEEYESTEEINEDKKKSFIDIIFESSNKKTKIVEIIKNLNKIKISNIKLKKVYGIAQLIPRQWFLKDDVYINHVAKDYGEAFVRGLNNEIIKVIKDISLKTEENLESAIKKLGDTSEYLMLANRSKVRSLKCKYDNDYIYIEDKKIETIFTFDIENIILIKKSSIPEIEICKFDKIYDKNKIKDNIYINIEDCSNNEELRNKIIKNSEWIQEKGNLIEQHNYLKKLCELRIFKAYTIIKPEEIESIEFIESIGEPNES